MLLLTPSQHLTQEKTADGHALGTGVSLLHIAVILGKTKVVQRVLELGADVNAPLAVADDMTPLHLAIVHGKRELLASIVEQSAETLDAIEQPGVLYLSPEIPRLLLEHGAYSTARDRASRRTPLEWAGANLEDETDRREVIALLQSVQAA